MGCSKAERTLGLIGYSIITLTVSLVLLAPCFGEEKPGASNKQEPLRVTWEYAGWSLPFLVALDQGLFEEAGVNVKPRKLGGPVTLDISETDIVNGHGLYLMSKQEVGPDHVKFIHTISMTKAGDMIKGFLVKKDAGVTSWQDLKGQKKQVALGSSDDITFIIDFLRKQGLTVFGETSDVTSFLVGYSGKFAETPNAVALYGWATDVRKYMEGAPESYVLLAKNLECEYEADPYYVACTYVNTESCGAKAEMIDAYVRGIDKAIEFIRQHPKEALAVIPKYTDWKPEEAARMGLYHFDKSVEIPNFAALQKVRSKDLRPFHFTGATASPDKTKTQKPSSEASLPAFAVHLNGPREVRVRNPNDFVVHAGVRKDKAGVNFEVPANGNKSVYVPDGRHEIYFVYSDKSDALFKGDDFTLDGHGVEIKIVKVVGGNYGIRQVK